MVNRSLSATAILLLTAISMVVSRSPNVIIMVIDQMYFLSSMPESAPPGSTTLFDYDTPNIKALYDESVVFTTSYAGGPTCAPSRYSLLTGRHASRCEEAVNEAVSEGTEIYGAEVSIYTIKLDNGAEDVDQYNIANVLRNDPNNPYYTGQVGKWHLMPAGTLDGTCSTMTESPAEAAYPGCTEEVKQLGFDFVDAWYFANIQDNDHFSHNPEWMVSQSQRFIEEAQAENKPFFLYFATTLLHSPSVFTAMTDFDFTASPKGTLRGTDIPDDTAMTPREDLVQYLEDNDMDVARPAGYVWIDDMVGALMSYLKDNNLFDDTIFIFMNDHGMDSQTTLYQGGSRIINFMRYPPLFGTDGPMLMDSDFVTSNIDVAATVFDLADISLPSDYVLDGVSVLDDVLEALSDSKGTANAECCQFRFVDIYNSHSIVSGQYQYIYRATSEVTANGALDAYPHAMDEEQLYDLDADPDQLVNLMESESHWIVVSQFQQIMRDYLEDVCPAQRPGECMKPDLKYPDGAPKDDPTASPNRSGGDSRRSGSSSRRSSSGRSSSGRNGGSSSRSRSHSESVEEMEMANKNRMVIGHETMEMEWTHLEAALVLVGIIAIFVAYQLYARCVVEKAAKEMEQDAGHQRSSYAIVNGQVVY